MVTLSFDDGFERSCSRVADVYEQRGLSACLNVIASGHRPDFESPDEWQRNIEKGDFTLWNDLVARGHEVMPHGYRHAPLPALPEGEALSLMESCLATFEQELDGFDRSRAVFNFPYNLSSPRLERWLESEVRAWRTADPSGCGVNPLPSPNARRLVCTASGPAPCDAHLTEALRTFLAGPPGWLIYNLHGLDGEGWGPVGEDTLARRLDELLEFGAAILPAGRALARADEHTPS